MALRKRLLRHPILVATALVVGFGLSFADRLIFARALGRTEILDEPVVFVMNGLLTALPFLALSLRGRQHIVPWVVGVVPSAWLTWWWVQKGISYQLNPDGSGVDMGGAILMLLSPLVISAACLLLAQKLDDAEANGS